MTTKCKHVIGTMIMLLLLGLIAQAVAFERSEIPAIYTWKTDDLYPNLEAWKGAFDSVRAGVGQMEALRGTLGEKGGKNLCAFNTASELLDAQLSRIIWYAYYNYQVDMRNPEWTERRDEAFALGSECGLRLTWIAPELLSIPEDTLLHWANTIATLKPYQQQYQDLYAQRTHSLSDPEERILAIAGDLAGGPNDTYTNLMSVDMDFPSIIDDKGDTVSASTAGWRDVYRLSPDRATREKYFRAVFGRYLQFSNTCATTIASQFKTDAAFAKARHYEHSLEANLSPNFIPTETFSTLIRVTRANTAPLQKYGEIRKRYLGVEHYQMWDQYVPIGTADEERRYTWEQAAQAVVEAVRPLGKAYEEETRFVLDPANRLVDPFTSAGKIGGAWSHNSLCEPARMLFNFDYARGLTAGNITTIAHEAGHTLQANYTMRTQPFPLRADISLVAEVPSTTIETLNDLRQLDAARADFRKSDRKTREAARQRLIYALDQVLSAGANAFFRQVMFAEWEWKAHQLAENGEPLTNEALTQLYAELLHDYFGPALEPDEISLHMWASVPHFYLGFYTYSYAVGEVAALALATDILAEYRGDHSKRGTSERYLRFLKAGSSEHPDQLLKEAGVDLATPKPIDTFIRCYSQWVDELDQLTQTTPAPRR